MRAPPARFSSTSHRATISQPPALASSFQFSAARLYVPTTPMWRRSLAPGFLSSARAAPSQKPAAAVAWRKRRRVRRCGMAAPWGDGGDFWGVILPPRRAGRKKGEVGPASRAGPESPDAEGDVLELQDI